MSAVDPVQGGVLDDVLAAGDDDEVAVGAEPLQRAEGACGLRRGGWWGGRGRVA